MTDSRKADIRESRVHSMYQTVYKYAGFKNPDIDEQLVRTAADHWGWFRVLVESSFLLIVSTVILVCLQKWTYVGGFLAVILVEMVLMFVQGRACIRIAKPQVDAILSDPNRRNAIQGYFNSL